MCDETGKGEREDATPVTCLLQPYTGKNVVSVDMNKTSIKERERKGDKR